MTQWWWSFLNSNDYSNSRQWTEYFNYTSSLWVLNCRHFYVRKLHQTNMQFALLTNKFSALEIELQFWVKFTRIKIRRIIPYKVRTTWLTFGRNQHSPASCDGLIHCRLEQEHSITNQDLLFRRIMDEKQFDFGFFK